MGVSARSFSIEVGVGKEDEEGDGERGKGRVKERRWILVRRGVFCFDPNKISLSFEPIHKSLEPISK